MRKIEPEFITGMGYIGASPGVLYRMGGAGEQTVVTGNPALLENVKGSRFTSLTLHGKSTQEGTTGAQLFDFENAMQKIIGNWTNTNVLSAEDTNDIFVNWRHLKGIAQNYIAIVSRFKFEANKTIYITKKIGTHILIYDENGKNRENLTVQSYTPTESFNGYIGVGIDKGTKVNGSLIFSYDHDFSTAEPYTGGKPSPSPEYPQEIKSTGQSGEIGVEVLGKNLIPFPYPLLGGTGTQIERNGVKYTVQSDGGIRCVGTPTAVTYINLSRIKFSNVGLTATQPTDGKIVLSGEKMTYDPSNYALFIYITSDQLGKPIDTVIYPQIELGTVATEYEPYKPAQKLIIPTSGGLPGIHVSSGGNYTDEKGQQWVCDEIDLARGERVQWIGEYELTGKENVADFGLRPRVRMVSITIPDAYIDAGNHGSLKAVMSNKYKQVKFDELINNINLIARGQQRNICISIPTDIGIEDFKTDLSNQYASGRPVKVFYKLATPIRTPLPPETIAAYKALRTYSPTTTVINDACAGMSVGYKRK